MIRKDGETLAKVPHHGVYVFPTTSEMYDYVEHTKTYVKIVEVLADYAGIQMPMYFLQSPIPQYSNSHWIFRVLKKPLDHPEYGRVSAWGFWLHQKLP